MDDIYTRWPHASLASMYQIFPPSGGDPKRVAAGAAVISVLEDFWKTSASSGRSDGSYKTTGCALDINFEFRKSGLTFVSSNMIPRIPLLVRNILDMTFPEHSDFLTPAPRFYDTPAPYHGPFLLDAVGHPLLGGILGLYNNESFAVSKWMMVSTALKIVGAPDPSDDARVRMEDRLVRSSSSFLPSFEHKLKYLGSPIHDVLGKLTSQWFGDESPEYLRPLALSRFIFTDDRLHRKHGVEPSDWALQSRSRFLLHYPDASELFSPTAELGDELLELRHAIDTHEGNMLDDLYGLVDSHVQDKERFRRDPRQFIESCRKVEEARVAREYKQDLEEEQRRDDIAVHAIRTLGFHEYERRVRAGEDLPSLPDDRTNDDLQS